MRICTRVMSSGDDVAPIENMIIRLHMLDQMHSDCCPTDSRSTVRTGGAGYLGQNGSHSIDTDYMTNSD